MRKKRIEKKKPIQPCGTITDIRDYFKPLKNVGTFKKPKIGRKINR